MSSADRVWIRQLSLALVLITCIGGAAFVIVRHPHGDCFVVGEMMRTYTVFQQGAPPVSSDGPENRDDRLAAADAEVRTAEDLRDQAGGISLPPLRAAAGTFADGVARSARSQREDAERPPELDPFEAILPEVDPAELSADDAFYSAAHTMLTACPAVPSPMGLA